MITSNLNFKHFFFSSYHFQSYLLLLGSALYKSYRYIEITYFIILFRNNCNKRNFFLENLGRFLGLSTKKNLHGLTNESCLSIAFQFLVNVSP
jgi:hypothetical protein